jgi:hypothetical protein
MLFCLVGGILERSLMVARGGVLAIINGFVLRGWQGCPFMLGEPG